MPTPFNRFEDGSGEPVSEGWDASNQKTRRSVFGNYRTTEAPPAPQLENPTWEGSHSSGSVADEPKAADSTSLQRSIDIAMARMFLYQFLARAFEDPALESWAWLTDSKTQQAFHQAVQVTSDGSDILKKSVDALTAKLSGDRFEPFQTGYVTAFGHAARGDCPLNEIEYGDLKADPLFQPHRLADLAAFYRAFGLEVADQAAERPDHIGMELEFMSILAARDAYAREHQLDEEQWQLCRAAQKKFLREHLGRWSPAFSRRLSRVATDETLAALAGFTRDFIAAECARFGLSVGSEDLLLRPVDAAAENLCASCGLKTLPPGAASIEGT